jgi:hypothetical protein
MSKNVAVFFNRTKNLCYDPLLSDIFDNISGSQRLLYRGREYDKINFRNDKQRLLKDFNVAIKKAKQERI